VRPFGSYIKSRPPQKFYPHPNNGESKRCERAQLTKGSRLFIVQKVGLFRRVPLFGVWGKFPRGSRLYITTEAPTGVLGVPSNFFSSVLFCKKKVYPLALEEKNISACFGRKKSMRLLRKKKVYPLASQETNLCACFGRKKSIRLLRKKKVYPLASQEKGLCACFGRKTSIRLVRKKKLT